MATLFGDNNANSYMLIFSAVWNYGLDDDRVAGLGGSDTIYGGDGNDALNGGNDDDFLTDGDGNDTVVGGSGNDHLAADAGNDIYYGGSGIDTVDFLNLHVSAGGVQDINSTGIRFDLASTAVQNLGETGFDQFFGFENVSGSFGSDTLLGTSGANSLTGLVGNDTLDGRRGSDTVTGGVGADLLIGGLGIDDLYTGGADGVRDRVRFTSLLDSGVTSTTRDEVFQFVVGQDKIDLRLIDANLSFSGNQAFKVVSAFTNAMGEVRLVYSGADTYVRLDGDLDRSIDMDIRVVGVHLTAADLIL